MFRKADPSRRTPVWLQAKTKENAVWQLKLLVLFILGYSAGQAWNDYQERKRLNAPITVN